MSFLMYVAGFVAFAIFAVHAWQAYKAFSVLKRKWQGTYPQDEAMPAIAELVKFAKAFETYAPNLERQVELMDDSFVRESAKMLLAGTIKGQDYLRAVRQRAQTMHHEDLNRVRIFAAMDDVVPALGWALAITITFWLIRAPESVSYLDQVIPGLGFLAGFALYGLVFSLFVARPAVLQMQNEAKMRHMKNLLICEGFGQILRQKRSYEILDSLNLALTGGPSVKWGEVFPESQAKLKSAG